MFLVHHIFFFGFTRFSPFSLKAAAEQCVTGAESRMRRPPTAPETRSLCVQIPVASEIEDANARLLRQQREIISRSELKPLTKRNDISGLVRFALHLAAIVSTGMLVYAALDSYWVWPAVVLHGVLLNHLFAPVHECSHGTAFKTRWLNEGVLWFCGVLTIWPPLYFRYDHAGHHTYAQSKGNDPEQIFPPPRTLLGYFYVLVGLQLWVRTFGWLFNHAAGRVAPFNRRFVPESELPRIYFEARLMLAIYSCIAVASYWLGSWNAVIYWVGPLFLVSPVARALRLADHTGCAEETDLRTLARTVRTDPFTQFFCWNMNYHCEHHLAASVPFHALPTLHKKVGRILNPADKGYLAVQWEIMTRHVSGVFRRKVEDGGVRA